MLLIKISKRGKVTNIEKPDISFIKKNKHISKLNTWKYNNFDFVIYGCENGNAGEENKYDLPPPIDCELYFNDLYIIKLNNNKLKNLSIEEYNTFYRDFMLVGFTRYLRDTTFGRKPSTEWEKYGIEGRMQGNPSTRGPVSESPTAYQLNPLYLFLGINMDYLLAQQSYIIMKAQDVVKTLLQER